jgi:hypothetical protein
MPYNGIQVCSFSSAGQQALVAVESLDDDMMTDARLAEKAMQEEDPRRPWQSAGGTRR